jgi:sec-independent protein translocase protein TatA
MPNIGPLEIVIVLILALVVFGPKRLPELGQSMGKGIREFRGSISGDGGAQDAEVQPELQAPAAKAVVTDVPATKTQA